MILWINRGEFLAVMVLGLVLGLAVPALVDPARSLIALIRPWMVVNEIKISLVADEPVVTVHREIKRLVVGGRYGSELYELTPDGRKRQVCTGHGSGTYDPKEPALFGPISLERWLGGKLGDAKRCLPSLAAGRKYELVTNWCLPSPRSCEGQVTGPVVAFEMAPDWQPPAYGSPIR